MDLIQNFPNLNRFQRSRLINYFNQDPAERASFLCQDVGMHSDYIEWLVKERLQAPE
jgi:hypothetical protein